MKYIVKAFNWDKPESWLVKFRSEAGALREYDRLLINNPLYDVVVYLEDPDAAPNVHVFDGVGEILHQYHQRVIQLHLGEI